MFELWWRGVVVVAWCGCGSVTGLWWCGVAVSGLGWLGCGR